MTCMYCGLNTTKKNMVCHACEKAGEEIATQRYLKNAKVFLEKLKIELKELCFTSLEDLAEHYKSELGDVVRIDDVSELVDIDKDCYTVTVWINNGKMILSNNVDIFDGMNYIGQYDIPGFDGELYSIK